MIPALILQGQCQLNFLTASTFEEALVSEVNLGGDADSIGAVCGQLAGAKYGLKGIPERWLAAIKDREKIGGLFDRFLAVLP